MKSFWGQYSNNHSNSYLIEILGFIRSYVFVLSRIVYPIISIAFNNLDTSIEEQITSL